MLDEHRPLFSELSEEAEGAFRMQPTHDVSSSLARRLSALRTRRWDDIRLTQRELGRALGVSTPLISSWEKSTVPTPERLHAYATFFATHRSVDDGVVRMLPTDELTDTERAERDSLIRELLDLREAAPANGSYLGRPVIGPTGDPIGGGTWHFSDGKPITIVCPEFPADLRADMPYVNPAHPMHDLLSTFTNLDALFEIHGHVRAVNPASKVTYRSPSRLTPDDYTTHLVVLGGVDSNVATRNLLRLLDAPVTQVSGGGDGFDDAYFETHSAGETQTFRPRLLAERTLIEDVAHFYRGPNPYNRRRTVTLCNGVFSRGVLGAVRTLTDARFRDRNETYLQHRFGDCAEFSVLSRVLIVDGAVVTPDWTASQTRLAEWPEQTS